MSLQKQGGLYWVVVGLGLLAFCPAPLRGQASPSSDLPKYLESQIALGRKEIVIPPGSYRVSPRKREHLRLKGLKDVTIIAQGVELVCTETTRALTLSTCQNLTIRGLTIDYDPLPYTQGRIVGLSQDRMVHEIKLSSGYPTSEGVVPEKYEIFRGDTRTLRFGSYHDFSLEKVAPDRIRVTKGKNYRGDRWKLEQVGDVIAIACRYAPGGSIPHAIAIEECSQVTLEEVTVYSSPTFGFIEHGCEGTTYRKCRVDRKPAQKDARELGEARIRSLNADAFHSIGATKGPSYIECFARFQGDDCINIHGSYHIVMACQENRLRVLGKGDMDIQSGDAVELVAYEGNRLDDAAVVAVRRSGSIEPGEREFLSKQKMHSPIKSGEMVSRAYEVTLDRSVSLSPGSLIGSRNRMGNGFQVVGCDFSQIRSRGILIKASQGEVRGNKLAGCWGEAIKVSPEYWWLESGSSDDILIADNEISDSKEVGIAVYAVAGNGEIAPAGVHNRITIRGNQIRGSSYPGIVVTSTRELMLEANTLELDRKLAMPPEVLRDFLIEGPTEEVLLKNVEGTSATN